MADVKKKLSANTDGAFYVDLTCINCDTCRQLAPGVFGEMEGYAYVAHQPKNTTEREAALRSLLACPVGSIGVLDRPDLRPIRRQFPLLVEGDVYYCGFNARSSYGANSYFIRRTDGNILVDSPRFVPDLVRVFEAWGGIRHIFLTHRDDVADADKFSKHFGARRIMHEADRTHSVRDLADDWLASYEATDLADDVRLIPVPGHTAGSCVLLYRDRYLFTGDHLGGLPNMGELEAYPDFCWYSWEAQTRSMERLLEFSFEWVLPGHGRRLYLNASQMKAALRRLIQWMRKQ